MNRRKVLAELVFFIVLNLAFPLFCFSGEKDFDFSGYNVVFVSFDALQAKHTHSLGYFRKTTPLIDEFAKKGFLFTQAISQASWTLPASMSWFTSLYPSEHKMVNKYSQYSEDKKVFSNLNELSPDVITLAEILKKAGYATAAFTGDAGVSAKFGFGKGFDVYRDEEKFGGFEYSIPLAIQWISVNRNKKFMIFLHGYDMHGQYDSPGGYKKIFLDFDYKGKLKGGKEEQGRLREEGLNNGYIDLTDADVRFWRALYDEKIYDANQRFKVFVDELDKLGLLKKTIIILTSDHGTEFYEHRRFDHGFSLYDELIHVPLVIYLPGFKDKKIIQDQVRSIDLMPTILDLLKIETKDKVKNQMRGKSLLPLLNGEHMELDAFAETDYRLYAHKRAIRTADGWKFIYNLDNNKKELYNLQNDPEEKNNLINKEPRKAYELEQRLLRWLRSMKVDIGAYKSGKELKIKEY